MDRISYRSGILESVANIYFVDAYTPNEGEPALCLEYGVLRLQRQGIEKSRPEVFVHSYLKPANSPLRVNWLNAEKEMGITRDRIDHDNTLPTIDNMVDKNYLDGHCVVCFDDMLEPFGSLVMTCSHVDSIVKMWAEFSRDDEKAAACTTLEQMCDYVSLLPDNFENNNYTPFLKRLHRMAALWYQLTEILKVPPRSRKSLLGGMQFSYIWPLPNTSQDWFDHPASSLKDLTKDDIEKFFSSTMSDRINWFDVAMYGNDWMYERKIKNTYGRLKGSKQLASFIFNNVLDFNMQMWVLIFYSLYWRKNNVAILLAKSAGQFSHLDPASLENFSSFLIENMDSFLNSEQKNKLIASLVRQSLKDNGEKPFMAKDYIKLQKQTLKHKGQCALLCTGMSPEGRYSNSCWRITNDKGLPVFFRFEVKGNGTDRSVYIEFAIRQISMFYEQARNVLSDIWLSENLKNWIQYITGITFSEIVRPQRINDSKELNNVRTALIRIIESEAASYMSRLHKQFSESISFIRSSHNGDPLRFSFQGISFEIAIKPPKKLGLISSMFKFK
ncbi:MAG: hypothetical protein ACI4M9_00980 [Succinivibrio sp.]